MSIKLEQLNQTDVGKLVKYERQYCKVEYGTISSWNDKYVFVKFRGPNGEACDPEDVSFVFGEK